MTQVRGSGGQQKSPKTPCPRVLALGTSCLYLLLGYQLSLPRQPLGFAIALTVAFGAATRGDAPPTSTPSDGFSKEAGLRAWLHYQTDQRG